MYNNNTNFLKNNDIKLINYFTWTSVPRSIINIININYLIKNGIF